MKLLAETVSHISLDRRLVMKISRIAVRNSYSRQRFSRLCRKNKQLIGLANFLVLVNNCNIFPNIKEEINV